MLTLLVAGMICQPLSPIVLQVALRGLIEWLVLVLFHHDLDLADHVPLIDFFAVIAELGQLTLRE